jgi:hypothetical protein
MGSYGGSLFVRKSIEGGGEGREIVVVEDLEEEGDIVLLRASSPGAGTSKLSDSAGVGGTELVTGAPSGTVDPSAGDCTLTL